MWFSRQEYWSELWWPPPGTLPHSGIEPTFLKFPELAGGFFTISATWEAQKPTKGFPGGSVVKNLPTNTGDTGSILGPGRSHLLWSKYAHASQLLTVKECYVLCELYDIRKLVMRKYGFTFYPCILGKGRISLFDDEAWYDFMLSHENYMHAWKLSVLLIIILRVNDVLWAPPKIAETKSWTACILRT